MPAQATRLQKNESTSKPFRFDARLTGDQKLLIQRAADLQGRTLTDFVIQSAELAAEHTIQERTMLVLNAKDTETFVQSLLAASSEPGTVLQQAAKRYKERLGR